MRSLLFNMRLFCTFSLMGTLAGMSFASDDIDRINQAISEKGARWKAVDNWMTRLSLEEQRQLCGAILEPREPSQAKLLPIPLIDDLPSTLDWRDNNGNWVTPVKDQFAPKWCGSCWDFAAVAQVESWWKIHNAVPDSMIDLSEQFILSCGDAGSCDGGYSELALEFIRTTGIPGEACFPYQADDQILCSSACGNWQDEAVKIPGWGYVTLDEAKIDHIKSAVARHPVSAYMTVHQDFMSYSGGVYEYVWGGLVYGHMILIIGWDDSEQCWICKNSFGTDWGETANFAPYTPETGDGGFFRIKYGECEIGIYAIGIWDEMTSIPALVLSPDHVSISLTVGDSASRSITLSNLAPEELQFSSFGFETPEISYFHPDSFNAWEGTSWWCGDPELVGYGNSWLQYLDLPALNLSNALSPELSFMGLWSLEDPAGAIDFTPGFDGWDGCNVWISADGGKTFGVAHPVNAEYNCRNLYSFGGAEGWNMGLGIAGWGGSSGGWTLFEFDLSPFKSNSVIIRFAFASDGGICTQNDPLLHGFMVDDILISDGTDVLYENYGNDDTQLQRSGCSGQNRAEWLDIYNGAGSIPSHDSTSIKFTIQTRDLNPGHYHGFIYFLSNDTAIPTARFSIDMALRAPDHDIAVADITPAGGNRPILVHNEIGTEVKNVGLGDETDFDVVYDLLQDGHSIYNENVHITSLSSGDSAVVWFKPVLESQPKELELVMTLANLKDDYNDYNNRIRSSVTLSNVVDDFDSETGFWAYEGGWGITDRYAGHSGDFAVHVNSGRGYTNDMIAVMTFTPGFDLRSLEGATLTYWTKYNTELDKDICYLEASGDSLNWHKLDSLSGRETDWIQHEVGLTEYIRPEYRRVWVRFVFVSDSATVRSLGVVIDDVEIYPSSPTAIQRQDLATGIPVEWNLSQNYPNPFNPGTTIEYALPKAGNVRIAIYDVLGRHVKTLMDSRQPAGHFSATWNGRDESGRPVAAGVYFCRMEAGNTEMGSPASTRGGSANKSGMVGQKYVRMIKMALVR